MMKLKPNKMWVCIQKDLEKIYDGVSWTWKNDIICSSIPFTLDFGEACHEGKGRFTEKSKIIQLVQWKHTLNM